MFKTTSNTEGPTNVSKIPTLYLKGYSASGGAFIIIINLFKVD